VTLEVITMKLLAWLFLLACTVPALLLAVALGPVVIGVLCAVGCAVLVAGIAYALGVTAGAVEKVGARFAHRRD
jgi:hypothetical protein